MRAVITAGWLSSTIAATGCCPPPDPEDPSEVLPAPPPPAPTRPTPPALLSRMQRPVTAPPVPVKPPEREMLKEPPLVPPARPKVEVDPPRRETLAPPAPPVPSEPAGRLPDDVVLKLLEGGRAAFARCFKLAVKADPTVTSFKVKVHVELDGEGAITSASADADDQALAGCLSRATGWLKFPATGKRVVVELPLFYRGE